MKYIKLLALSALVFLPIISLASIDANLKYGSRGQEVTELQEFLIDKGFLQSQATGNFYSLTQKAVIAYQTSVSVPATGYVGVLTRGKINDELLVASQGADQAEVSETGTTTVPLNTSASAMTQQKIDALVQQVKDLLAQQQIQTQQIQAQTTQIQQTNQTLGTIAQNTTPTTTPVQNAPAPVIIAPMDKSDFIVTNLEITNPKIQALFQTIKLDTGNVYQFGFEFDVKDKNGKSFNWGLAKLSEKPDVHVTVALNGNQIENFSILDPHSPWYGSDQYNPSFSETGTYVFTFTTNGITKVVTIEVQ